MPIRISSVKRRRFKVKSAAPPVLCRITTLSEDAYNYRKMQNLLHQSWFITIQWVNRCTVCTVFENYSKCRIKIYQFWHFPSIFVLLIVTCLVTLFDRKLQVINNSPNWSILGIFARNVECDFLGDFQTLWYGRYSYHYDVEVELKC